MKRSTRMGSFTIIMGLTVMLCGSLAWAAPLAGKQKTDAPSNSYLASDAYGEDDTIKGVFLQDADYAKMTEDFKRNGKDFDWGWIAPDFDAKSYQTVHVTVKDDFGVLQPEFNKALQSTFEAAVKRLGWRVVGAGKADVELGLDIVGYDPDSHFAFVTTIQPSVELEIRLREKSGKDVYLVRNREHSATPAAAARETARDMIRQLNR